MIAAVAANSVIGKDNDLIWHLPDDLKFFKDTTKGHHIIMGRKNYESMGRALPFRTNVVISRNSQYQAEGAVVVTSLQEALDFAEKAGEKEAFIIGGGEIYKLGLPIADTMYLTFVEGSPEGDTFFPDFDKNDWNEVSRVKHPVDERHIYAFQICTFEKNSDI